MNSKTEEIVKSLRGCSADVMDCKNCVAEWGRKYGYCFNMLRLYAADRLEELETELSKLKAQQRWIPVTERLPEEGITVLTLDKRGHMRDRKLYTFRGGQRLFRPDGLAPGYDVLYWRSLPEPPKEEE